LTGGVTYRQPARTAPRRIRVRRIRVAGLLVVVAALLATGGWQLLATSLSTASSALPAAARVDVLPIKHRAPRGPLGEADGAVPDGTTIFDQDVPGVAKLDPALLGALRRAATDAGIEVFVDSGWRSPAYQQHLLGEAVAQYGSEAQAARWVATPTTSAHVSGDAVDVGHADATAWLSRHGAAYGLCQIYANEPWHYELRPDAAGGGCAPMYDDPTHDPRMQR
jgi:hypothetical protein